MWRSLVSIKRSSRQSLPFIMISIIIIMSAGLFTTILTTFAKWHTFSRGKLTCRHYLDRSTIFPIHLSEEGYTSFGVILDEEHLFEEIEHGQISAIPTIDADQDWVVRVSFYPQIEEHFHHPQRVPFVVRATRENEFSVDTICLGELIILPAAYEATDTED